MVRIGAAVDPRAKGLFRTALAGPGGTIRAAFERLAVAPGGHPRRVDRRWNAAFTRVDLPGDEGTGCWKLLSVGDDIYMIVTDCDYRSIRFERVPSEGLVGFHFVLEGPVELTVPRDCEPVRTAGTVMACHQAPGVSYDVCCLPGRFRMISLYVRPELLAESFGFGGHLGARVARLLEPEPGAMSVLEVATNLEIVTALRDAIALDVSLPRDMMLAMAKVVELLAKTTDLLAASAAGGATGTAFTERELAMFAKARAILSQDPGASQTITGLARQLGTNATKLKSGFKLLHGTTVFNYRHHHRMARAMEMLGNPEVPIAAISHAVGYEHQASFATAFKAHFGISPKEARKLTVQRRTDGEHGGSP